MSMSLLVVFGIGVLEWVLATTRTIALIKKKVWIVASICFSENLLALGVLSFFVKSGDWWIAISYSAGAALGSLLPLKIGRFKK